MDRLTAAHRNAQLALRAKVLRDLHRIWPALNPDDLARTFTLWATVAASLIDRNRRTSAALASSYYRSTRFQAGLTDAFTIPAFDPLPAEQINVALRATTLSPLLAAKDLDRRDQALATAFVRSSGAVTRLVLDGGRETIRAAAIADPRAQGWQRVASGRACRFCTTLADRGGVYSQGSVAFSAHDHCGCTAQPVYR